MARGGGQIAFAPQQAFQQGPHPLQLLAQAIPAAFQAYQQAQEQQQEKAARQQIMDRQTAMEDNDIARLRRIRDTARLPEGQRPQDDVEVQAYLSNSQLQQEVDEIFGQLEPPEGQRGGRGQVSVARQRASQLWRELNDDDNHGLFSQARAAHAGERSRQRASVALQELSRLPASRENIGKMLELAGQAQIPPPVIARMVEDWMDSGILQRKRTQIQTERERGAFIADRGATPKLFDQLGIEMPEGAVSFGAPGSVGANISAERRAASFANGGGRAGASGATPLNAKGVLDLVNSRLRGFPRQEGVSQKDAYGTTFNDVLNRTLDEIGDALPVGEEAAARGGRWNAEMVEARRGIRASWEGRTFATPEEGQEAWRREGENLIRHFGRAHAREILRTINPRSLGVTAPQMRPRR